MTWFRIDDGFYDHPKVADLPDSAIALWTRAGAYCSRHLTDGAISRRTARRLCDDPDEAIEALIKSGLWSQDGDDFRFHDWNVYNPSAAEEKAARDAQSSGGHRGNHERWHVKKNRFDPSCKYCKSGFGANKDQGTDRVPDRPTDQEPDRVSIGGTESYPNPPSRPVPSRPVKNQEPLTAVASLTKQDHSQVSKPIDEMDLPAAQRPRKVWCPEHAAPDDRQCNGCLAAHGDRAYHAKQRAKGAAK